MPARLPIQLQNASFESGEYGSNAMTFVPSHCQDSGRPKYREFSVVFERDVSAESRTEQSNGHNSSWQIVIQESRRFPVIRCSPLLLKRAQGTVHHFA